jgi:hypothetical protein
LGRMYNTVVSVYYVKTVSQPDTHTVIW